MLKLDTDNHIIPFIIDSEAIRGRIAKFNDILEHIISLHNYPAPVATLLAECAIAVALIGDNLKFDGVITLQLTGDAIVKSLVVDYFDQGKIRGYAQFEGEMGEGAVIPLNVIAGSGYLSLTIYHALGKDPYQGVVGLDHETVASALEAYFRQSEQIKTRFAISAGRCYNAESKKYTYSGGGIMLQNLPKDHDDPTAWQLSEMYLSTIKPHELIDPMLKSRDLLYNLFNETQIIIYGENEITVDCRCSREKMQKVLEGFAPEDLAEMHQDGKITMNCEFCNRVEEFYEI